MIFNFKQPAGHGSLIFSTLAAMVLCVSAHAQNKDTDKDAASKPKYGVNKSLGDTYAAVRSVADEQTRLVLYRAPVKVDKLVDKQGDQQGVVSVYLNDRYHASLHKLTLTGDGNDTVELDLSQWANSGTTVTEGDHTYAVYNASSAAAAQLLIDQHMVLANHG